MQHTDASESNLHFILFILKTKHHINLSILTNTIIINEFVYKDC